MNITQRDLELGVHRLGVTLDQVTVNEYGHGVSIKFTDYVDVFRFWVNVARSQDLRSYVSAATLLDDVAVDDEGANLVLTFDGIRVTDRYESEVPASQTVAESGTGDDDTRLERIEATVNQLAQLARQHLGVQI